MEFSAIMFAKLGLLVLGFSLAYAWRICALNEVLGN